MRLNLHQYIFFKYFNFFFYAQKKLMKMQWLMTNKPIPVGDSGEKDNMRCAGTQKCSWFMVLIQRINGQLKRYTNLQAYFFKKIN